MGRFSVFTIPPPSFPRVILWYTVVIIAFPWGLDIGKVRKYSVNPPVLVAS